VSYNAILGADAERIPRRMMTHSAILSADAERTPRHMMTHSAPMVQDKQTEEEETERGGPKLVYSVLRKRG